MQGSPSSQTMGRPTQAPASQWSPAVQGSPSTHSPPSMAAWEQPAAPSQLSVVQGLSSSQRFT